MSNNVKLSYAERLEKELNEIILLNEAQLITKTDVKNQKANFEGRTFPQLREAESSNESKPTIKTLIMDKLDMEGVKVFINTTRTSIPDDGPINANRTKKLLEATEELNNLKQELDLEKYQYKEILKRYSDDQNQELGKINKNKHVMEEMTLEKLALLKEIEASSEILKRLASLLPPDQEMIGNVKRILKDSKEALNLNLN